MRPQFLIVSLFTILAFLFTPKAHCQEPAAQVVSVEQLQFINPYRPGLSDIANVTICVFNPTDTIWFFNMVALCPFSTQDHWAIQNLPVPPFMDTMYVSMWVPIDPCGIFPDGNFLEGLEVNIYYGEQLFLFPPPFSFSDQIFLFSQPGIYDILSNPREHLLPLAIPNSLFFPLEPLLWDPFIPYTYKERACAIPNIDLNNAEHPASPTYAGDKNACVPAATANSFMWLAEQHPEIAAIIQNKYGNDSTTHRKLLEDISGTFDRADCAGVNMQDFVSGKQTFVDNCQFPMKVKFQNVFHNHDILSNNGLYGHFAENQNTNNREIDMDWVLGELCDGEDVEIDMDCYMVDPATGDIYYDYGHCMTLSGAYNVGGNWGFSFKDDSKQGEEGGTQQGFSWLRNDPTPGISGRLVIERFSGDTFPLILVDTANMPVDTIDVVGRCILSDVVSESFDSGITFDTVPCPTTLTITNDTLCSGIYQASDTICLNNVNFKAGQDFIVKAPYIKADAGTKVELGCRLIVDTVGCVSPP